MVIDKIVSSNHANHQRLPLSDSKACGYDGTGFSWVFFSSPLQLKFNRNAYFLPRLKRIYLRFSIFSQDASSGSPLLWVSSRMLVWRTLQYFSISQLYVLFWYLRGLVLSFSNIAGCTSEEQQAAVQAAERSYIESLWTFLRRTWLLWTRTTWCQRKWRMTRVRMQLKCGILYS